MTDKERAEEYRKSLKQRLIDEDNFERLEMFDENVEEAYLAGLKVGRETEREYVKNNAFTSMKEQRLFPFGKWHDLRKDPNDLPLVHSTVLDENDDKVDYIGYGKWQVYSEYYERNIEIDPPIAWCEAPTFTDEE